MTPDDDPWRSVLPDSADDAGREPAAEAGNGVPRPALLDAVFEGLGEPLLVVGVDRRVLAANGAFRAAYAVLTGSDQVGERLDALLGRLAPREAVVLSSCWERALRGDTLVAEIEVRPPDAGDASSSSAGRRSGTRIAD